MANVQERRNKNGKLISYSIRVHRGRGADGKQLKPYTATFNVEPTWTEKSARKKAEAFAATFEKACREGTATDSRQTFAPYCEYVLDLKEQRGKVKHSTLVRYRELTKRIYPEIGHIKLRDLRADHLNDLYTQLGRSGVRHGYYKAICTVDLPAMLKKQHISKDALSVAAHISHTTVATACKGEKISAANAEKISTALNRRCTDLFQIERDTRPLSPKTVLEYHRFISSVLEQAEKEGLVLYNVAGRAEPPHVERKDVNFFQPETVVAIRDALNTEPIKWRTLTHLLLITGCRRGEILGLKWNEVNMEANKIRISNNVLYAPDIGVYEDTPKTKKSIRYISIPAETMQLLKQYRAWQTKERLRMGEYFTNRDFVFSQENGQPMHPDTVNDWLNKFSQRHGLPHINPHAFRHSMASILIYNGVDPVTISHRLGHAQVSTTENIYAHMIEDADQKSADVLSDVFLKRA